MAKRTKSRHSRALVVRAPSAPRPIVLKQTKIVKAKSKKHHKGRGRSGGAFSLGNFASADRVGIAIGSFLTGKILTSDWGKNLPSVPVLGRTGALALGAYFFSDGGRNRIADDVCTAALAIAGYSLGSTGSIVGEDPEDGWGM